MTDLAPVSEPQNAPGVPSSAPAADPAPSPTVEADVKARLEYVLTGSSATIRYKGTRLTFKKWGLRKNLQMGAKVIKMVSTVQRFLPNIAKENIIKEADIDFGVFADLLSYMADDVMEIVAGSIDEPFATTDAAERWLDENVQDLSDLFDLAYIVYEMNLKGDNLGKLLNGVKGLTQKVASLSTSSSKN